MEEEGYRTVREREAGKEARQTGRRRITDEAHTRHHPELEDICAPQLLYSKKQRRGSNRLAALCTIKTSSAVAARNALAAREKKEEERNEQPSMNANQRGSASR